MRGTATSYSVFVRFRRSRLRLRCGIQDVDEAITTACELRKERFHDKDAVFVVQEPEGVIVELPEGPDSGVVTPRAPFFEAQPSLSAQEETSGQARRAAELAHEARARFDLAYTSMERAMEAGGERVPPALRRCHAKLGQVRAISAAAVAALEHNGVASERRSRPPSAG